MKPLFSIFFGLAVFVVVYGFEAIQPANAADSHAGYYYPEAKSEEVYISPLNQNRQASRRTRVGFTIGLSGRQLKRGYAPTYHLYAKGKHAEKLIIVATNSTHYTTLYQLRALLAALTSEARTSNLFQESPRPEDLNFLDLAKLIGFERVTISNGNDLTHRIDIE